MDRLTAMISMSVMSPINWKSGSTKNSVPKAKWSRNRGRSEAGLGAFPSSSTADLEVLDLDARTAQEEVRRRCVNY
jgi:hypothetical protein